MYLFPALQNAKDPLIIDFLSNIPCTLMQAYDKMMNDFADYTFEGYILSNRQKMLEPIIKFHREADTLTKAVDCATNDLKDPSTKILVSTHQPNLFAYSGIFKKIVLLQTLKELILNPERGHSKLKMINLFVIIDHDFADENWIRVAQLPSIKHNNGIMQLRLPVDKSKRWQMVCKMPLPNRSILENWRIQLFSWIKKSFIFEPYISTAFDLQNMRSTLMSNLESLWKIVEESYSIANTYSDFNSFFMSKIVNRLWQYDTLFIRLTDLSQVFVKGYANLLRNYDSYSKTLREADQVFMKRGIPSGVSNSSYLNSPLWLHCKCGSKSATKISNKRIRSYGAHQEVFVLEGDCLGCKKHLIAELVVDEGGGINSPDAQVVSNLSPRSIPIVLLLSTELGISTYVSGRDGMRYVLFGNRLFKQFSQGNIPLFIVWPARDVYYGFAQCDALRSVKLKNYGEIGSYIQKLKEKEEHYRSLIAPMLCERNQRIKESRSGKEDYLSVLFSHKKNQRNIRAQMKLADKVKNISSLRPCIIDYAINFGLQDTELQWRQNLLSSSDLTCQNELSPKFAYMTLT